MCCFLGPYFRGPEVLQFPDRYREDNRLSGSTIIAQDAGFAFDGLQAWTLGREAEQSRSSLEW